jgi:DNA-binding NtrC family response regulator
MATILIVEDEIPIRRMMSFALTDTYAVFEASEGNEALEIMAGKSCDLIITDVDMPGMNGLELAERVLAERPGFPILIVTGQLNSERQATIDRLGLMTLEKPYSPNRMLVLVAALLK